MHTTFDPDEVRGLYERALRERDAVSTEQKRLTRVLAHLDQVIAGLTGLVPEIVAVTAVTPTAPTTQPASDPTANTTGRAVAVVLGRDPQWTTVKDVAAELAVSEVAARRQLRRAVERGAIEKGNLDGRTTAYRAPTDTSDPAGVERAGSEVGVTTTGEGGAAHAQGYDGDRSPDHPSGWNGDGRNPAAVLTTPTESTT